MRYVCSTMRYCPMELTETAVNVVVPYLYFLRGAYLSRPHVMPAILLCSNRHLIVAMLAREFTSGSSE